MCMHLCLFICECVSPDFGMCSQNVSEIEFVELDFRGHVCMPCIFAFGVAAGKNHATLFFSFIFAWSITLVRFIFLSPASISWSALSCLKLLSEYLFDTIVCVCIFFSLVGKFQDKKQWAWRAVNHSSSHWLTWLIYFVLYRLLHDVVCTLLPFSCGVGVPYTHIRFFFCRCSAYFSI